MPAQAMTAAGRTILDMSSLAECSNLGHQHPRVVATTRALALLDRLLGELSASV